MELYEMIKQTEDFEYDSKKYKYDLSYPELSFSKGNRNYNAIIKRLTTITLPNPENFKYTNLSLEELKEYLSSILNKIFDSTYSKEIEEYNSKIKLFKTSNPFDAMLETTITDSIDIPEIKHIHISDELVSIEVAATAHEYIHGLLSLYNTSRFNDVISNYHYKELLSILIEYITVYELSNLLKQNLLQNQHNIIRLSTDQAHIMASSENKALLYSNAIKGMSPSFINVYKRCVDYGEHNAFGCIISDIYSTRLFKLYQDDPKTLLNIFKSIIDGQKSIKDLLSFYNISMRDTETYITFNERLQNIPKL